MRGRKKWEIRKKKENIESKKIRVTYREDRQEYKEDGFMSDRKMTGREGKG